MARFPGQLNSVVRQLIVAVPGSALPPDAVIVAVHDKSRGARRSAEFFCPQMLSAAVGGEENGQVWLDDGDNHMSEDLSHALHNKTVEGAGPQVLRWRVNVRIQHKATRNCARVEVESSWRIAHAACVEYRVVDRGNRLLKLGLWET